MTPTVVVVGSINVDLVTRVDRLPAAGETVIGSSFEQTHGGKGANQAVASSRLGARVVLVGMLGDDELGASARADLAREGVALDEVRTGRGRTGVAQILVDAAGENLIAVASGVNDELTGAMVEESLGRLDVDRAVITSVLEVPHDAVLAGAREAERRGWPFVLNPAPARPIPRDLVARCDVLSPNEHEVAGLGHGSAEGLLAAGAGAVVITRGAGGADLLRSGHPPHRQAAFEARVVDTTGAGDAFTAALAWALAEGRDLQGAVEFGAACAAVATETAGARTGMPTRAQAEARLASS